MAAIPFKTSADDQRLRQRQENLPPETVPKTSLGSDDVQEIPIFCAGGCGEVMGYIGKGQSIPTCKCARCKAMDNAKTRFVKPEELPANTDELAELRTPSRDLRKFRVVQVAAVALIFAGSAYIAMGQVPGIYLAALGTLAWIAVELALWKLRN